MEPAGLFKNLALDVWYKALVYVGGLGFLTSIFIVPKAVRAGHLVLFSLGLFFFGLGEWKNHKKHSQFIPPNAYTGGVAGILTGVGRAPDALGLLFDLLGILLAAIGLICIVIDAIRG